MDDIFVGRLMSTAVVTVESNASVRAAAKRMTDADVGSLVVVVDGDDPVGILTTTDFVEIVASGDSTAAAVDEHMSTDVVTTTVNEPVATVAETMTTEGIHHLPVVDDDTGVIGMVTTTDLTAYLSGVTAAGSGGTALA